MAHTFKKGELTQFEEYTVGALDSITEKLETQKKENLPKRVQALESDAKWYKKIFAGIWVVTGGVIVVAFEYFFTKKGG